MKGANCQKMSSHWHVFQRKVQKGSRIQEGELSLRSLGPKCSVSILRYLFSTFYQESSDMCCPCDQSLLTLSSSCAVKVLAPPSGERLNLILVDSFIFFPLALIQITCKL